MKGPPMSEALKPEILRLAVGASIIDIRDAFRVPSNVVSIVQLPKPMIVPSLAEGCEVAEILSRPVLVSFLVEGKEVIGRISPSGKFDNLTEKYARVAKMTGGGMYEKGKNEQKSK